MMLEKLRSTVDFYFNQSPFSDNTIYTFYVMFNDVIIVYVLIGYCSYTDCPCHLKAIWFCSLLHYTMTAFVYLYFKANWTIFADLDKAIKRVRYVEREDQDQWNPPDIPVEWMRKYLNSKTENISDLSWNLLHR